MLRRFHPLIRVAWSPGKMLGVGSGERGGAVLPPRPSSVLRAPDPRVPAHSSDVIPRADALTALPSPTELPTLVLSHVPGARQPPLD